MVGKAEYGVDWTLVSRAKLLPPANATLCAPDNIDQRIQQDAQDFITSTIEFIRGMLNSVISSMEFAIVLWGWQGYWRCLE